MKLLEAVKRRLRRNYLWLLLIVLAAWMLKVRLGVALSGSSNDLARFLDAASVGTIPGQFVVALIFMVYLSLLVFACLPGREMDHLPRGGVNV
jgi:uncharacterized membrane protein